MATLVERLTAGPARVVGRPDVCSGTLRPGSPADVTILDPQAEWTVNAAEFTSKGRNTPLDGAILRGKVMATIVGGRVVYSDEAVKIG
jgi:dihydroorotase